MDHLQAMLDSQPHHPSAMEAIHRCIAACFDCAQACTTCADACLAEQQVQGLVYCIRLDLDCADVCATTGRIVSRLTKPNRELMEATLQSCVHACRACAAECRKHAGTHAHCRVCAEACDACGAACQTLLDAMR